MNAVESSFAQHAEAIQKASIARRLASLFYDSLLVFSLLFFATAILLPFTEGHAIESGNPLFGAYLVIVSFFYFGFSWTRGGQTLGMRAWRIKAVSESGAVLSWRQSMIRFCSAFAGLGLLGMVLSPNRNAWHDALSASVTIVVAKKPDS